MSARTSLSSSFFGPGIARLKATTRGLASLMASLSRPSLARFEAATGCLAAHGRDVSLHKSQPGSEDSIDCLRTCLSSSMLANPPWWLDWPPLRAMFSTSSCGRLAKFPGLGLEDMLVYSVAVV